jgi:transcription elongation factor GreB
MCQEVTNKKNYMTPHGYKKLVDELKHLKYKERPELCKVIEWAAGNGDRSENGDYIYGKKRLREIDRRISYLNDRVKNAEVIDPLTLKGDKIQFGATVTIRDEDDQEKVYSIVGVDEIEIEKGKISWVSPLGATLLRSKLNDCVTFKTPKGEKEIEVVKVEYIEILSE